MEMATVKSEAVNMGRRRLSMVDGESPEIKCNKRRRREPTGPAIGCDGQQGEQKHKVGNPKTATCTTTVKRSSKFRGVSRHRWTGRYEAHLWDKASWNVTQKKKGKQVYLGAYDEEESAARAYDLAALKYWGPATFTNFPVYDYETEIEIMQNVSKEEYLASLRRKSSGFSRGVSKYRGVARHHHNGRWEARIGRVFGNKYLYLGTYGTQEEAAHAYDIAAIEYRGVNAVTNFDLSTYIKWLRPVGDPVHSRHDTQDIVASQEFPSSSNIIPKGEHKQLFQNSPFTTDAIDFPQRTQLSQGKSPSSSSCTPTSSTTALSLLFRSSIFKDLVEKNSSASEDETVCEDTRQATQINSNDEYRDIFYAGSTDTQYVGDVNIQLGDSESSFYGQTRHTPWNLNDPL